MPGDKIPSVPKEFSQRAEREKLGTFRRSYLSIQQNTADRAATYFPLCTAFGEMSAIVLKTEVNDERIVKYYL